MPLQPSSQVQDEIQAPSDGLVEGVPAEAPEVAQDQRAPPHTAVSMVKRMIGNLSYSGAEEARSAGQTPKMASKWYTNPSREPSKVPSSAKKTSKGGASLAAAPTADKSSPSQPTSTKPSRKSSSHLTNQNGPSSFVSKKSVTPPKTSRPSRKNTLRTLGLQTIGVDDNISTQPEPSEAEEGGDEAGEDEEAELPPEEQENEEAPASPSQTGLPVSGGQPSQAGQQQSQMTGSPSMATSPAATQSGPIVSPAPSGDLPSSSGAFPVAQGDGEMKEELSAEGKDSAEEPPSAPYNTWAVFGILLLLAIGLYILYPYVRQPIPEETWYDCKSTRDRVCIKDLSMLWMLGCFLTKFIVMIE